MCTAPARNRGFTLIELLVVIVIISVLAGMAVLSLGSSGGRAWRGEVQRLAALLQLVADRALIDKAHYGVRLESDSYRVLRFDQTTLKWQPLETSASTASAARFASRELPGNMRIEVLKEAELPASAPVEFAADKKKSENPIPQFVALSSGEILPVELAMYLLVDGDVSSGAAISYSSLNGLQLEWQVDD